MHILGFPGHRWTRIIHRLPLTSLSRRAKWETQLTQFNRAIGPAKGPGHHGLRNESLVAPTTSQSPCEPFEFLWIPFPILFNSLSVNYAYLSDHQVLDSNKLFVFSCLFSFVFSMWLPVWQHSWSTQDHVAPTYEPKMLWSCQLVVHFEIQTSCAYCNEHDMGEQANNLRLKILATEWNKRKTHTLLPV